jgi:GNAT superfamily N-acetyltransferase
VQVDSYQSAYRGLFPDDYLAQLSYAEQEQDWRLWLSAHPEEIFLVAELPGGQIGGYVRGGPGSELDGYDCELAALHVRQEYQGGGVGRSLLQAFSREMKTAGRQRMMLWVLSGNQKARKFYEHSGGCQVGEKRWTMDDFEVVEVAYGWDLESDLM